MIEESSIIGTEGVDLESRYLDHSALASLNERTVRLMRQINNNRENEFRQR